MSNRIIDIWEAKTPWLVEDAKPGEKTVDGKVVIGRVKGPFFVPDGTSRNNRFYSKQLWEEVIGRPEVTDRLSNKMMFGMIGHEEKPVTEEDLRNGDVSHIVSKLWIAEDTGEGMGEALILGTESGKNLYIYLKAGCKLKTSSRAAGTFESGNTRDGVPVVDKQTYILETFDFVINAGFTAVNPSLVESLLKGNEAMKINLEKILTESRESLQAMMKEVLIENERLMGQIPSERQKAFLAIAESASSVEDLKLVLDAQRVLGLRTSEEIKNFWAKMDSKGVKAVLESKQGFVSDMFVIAPDISALGTVKELQTKLTELENYRKLGPAEKLGKAINRATEVLKEYVAIGTPKKIKQIVDRGVMVLEKYTKLGSYAQLSENMKKLKQVMEESKKKDLDGKAATLSEKFDVELGTARSLVEKMTVVEAEKVLTESRGAPRATKPEDDDSELSESMHEGASSRFFRSVTPRTKTSKK